MRFARVDRLNEAVADLVRDAAGPLGVYIRSAADGLDTEAWIVGTQALAVEKIIGSKMASDGNSTLIELSAAGGMYHFALSPNLLMDLLLTALKARTNWDQIKAPGAARATVLPCDKWEICTLNKGRPLVFCLPTPERSLGAVESLAGGCHVDARNSGRYRRAANASFLWRAEHEIRSLAVRFQMIAFR